MIFGFNTEITYRGEKFHIQTEDRGLQRPVIETLVYKGGEIVFSRKINYSFLIGRKDLKERVKEKLKNQHETIIKEIQNGLHDELLGFEPDETNEKMDSTEEKISKASVKTKPKKEKEIDKNEIVEKIKKHIENIPEDFLSFRIYFPFMDVNDKMQTVLIIGKIEDLIKEEPVISAKVIIEIKDKKNKILTSSESRTNFYGEYKVQLMYSPDTKPYWASIRFEKANKIYPPVSFFIR